MDDADTVSMKMGTLMMGVSSYAVFHVTSEEEFKEKYSSENGYSFLIFDKALDEIREMNYKVSEDVKALADVEEVF